jgi:hypothetical protein
MYQLSAPAPAADDECERANGGDVEEGADLLGMWGGAAPSTTTGTTGNAPSQAQNAWLPLKPGARAPHVSRRRAEIDLSRSLYTWRNLRRRIPVLAPRCPVNRPSWVSNPQTLGDFLIAAPCLSREQMAPVMRYFEAILRSRKRFLFAPKPKVNLKSATDGFQLFSKLPNEIRLLIWNFALPGPRIFEIYHSPAYLLNVPSKLTNQELASLASTCKESEAAVLTAYHKIRIFSVMRKGADHRSSVLISYEKDTFYFVDANLSSIFRPLFHGKRPDIQDRRGLDVMKTIAVRVSEMCSRYQWGPLREGAFLEWYPFNMARLEEIVFVVDQGMAFRGEDPQREDTERPLPGPYVRTDEDDEPDHPDFNNYFEEIESIRDGLELPAVSGAYEYLKVSFAIFRRSATVLQ